VSGPVGRGGGRDTVFTGGHPPPLPILGQVLPRLNGVIKGGGLPRSSVEWVGARPQCGRAAELFGGVAPSLGAPGAPNLRSELIGGGSAQLNIV